MIAPDSGVSPFYSGRMTDVVAVVTGATQGIGTAIARRFAREGANVVVNSRSAERVTAVVAEMQREGLGVAGFAGDMTVPAQANALADNAVSLFGRIDTWVNNAGMNFITPSLEISPEKFREIIDLDLNAVFYASQAAGRHMVRQGSGVIIQIGSIYSEVGMRDRAAYCAAKHGVIGLTKALSSEWAPMGVRVVCVQPGYTRTPMDEQARGRGAYVDEDVQRRTPMGRFASPEEVAGVVAFAASRDAAFMSGSSLTIDGGWIAYGGW
jgi:3-oxoacyl-[acyl-carrier protein] reductase